MLSWPRGGVLELRSSMGRSEHVRRWDGSSHPLQRYIYCVITITHTISFGYASIRISRLLGVYLEGDRGIDVARERFQSLGYYTQGFKETFMVAERR